MGRFFKIRDMNLTLDSRERQWITMILFARFFLTLQKNAVPGVRFFERNRHSATITTYFLFWGRITLSDVRMTAQAKRDYGVV